MMNDGHWEAVRSGHSDSQANPDSESASGDADAESRAGSCVRQSTEVIIGWRVWRLCHGGEFPRGDPRSALTLQSTYMDTLWPPGQFNKACCEVKRMHHGIHAFATAAQAISYMANGKTSHQHVYGEVSLWGRVVVHEHGYRAECAYPKRIYVPTRYQGGRDVVNALRRTYGIEVQWSK
jgi:hypothetical protein